MDIDYVKLQLELQKAIETDKKEENWKNRANFFTNLIKNLSAEYNEKDTVKYSTLLGNNLTFGFTVWNYMLTDKDIWLVGYIDTREVRIFRIKHGTYGIDDFAINNDDKFKANKNAVDNPDRRDISIPSREDNGKLIEQRLEKVDFKPHLWKTIDFEHRKIIDNPKYAEVRIG